MSSVKLTSKTSSTQKPLKFVVGAKNINEVPGPFLATFGTFPSLDNIDPNGADPLQFDAFSIEKKQLATAKTNDNNIFNTQYILKGETSKTEYHSTTHDSKRANHSKYLVGIFNPSTNEVELVPTPGIFLMEQARKNVKLFFETAEDDIRRRNARSLQVFGSSGAKAVAKRMTQDSIHEGSGNITKTMVDDLRHRLEENPDNSVEHKKLEVLLDLPSPNFNAENVNEIYDPLNIIPETIWNTIPRMPSGVALQEKLKLHRLPIPAGKILERIQQQKGLSLTTKILKERLVVFATIICFIPSNLRKMVSATFIKEHSLNPILVEHIFATFGSVLDIGGKITKFGGAKAIAYGLVALLLAFDLSLDQEILDAFAEMYRLTPEEMKVALPRVGCTITKTGAQLIDPWKVWAKAATRMETIEAKYAVAKKRAYERVIANKRKAAEGNNTEEGAAEEAADVDPNAMDLDLEEEKPKQEEQSNVNDDDDFVSGTKGGEHKKRARKSIGEKPKENPLNKKKKM